MYNLENVHTAFPRLCIENNHKGVNGLKYYQLITYLRISCSAIGIVTTTLSNMINECGYNPGKNKDSAICKNFIMLLKELIEENWISINKDIDDVKLNEIIIIDINSEDLFRLKGNFVTGTAKDFYTIAKSDININKAVVYAVYLYIKSNICFNKSQPRIAVPYSSKAVADLGISENTFFKAVKALHSLDMIYKSGTYLYISGENIYTCRTAYSIDKQEMTEENVKATLFRCYHGCKIIRKKTKEKSDEI